MAAQLSMDGFEIRIKDKILEMRTEGMRTAGMGQDPERAFESLTRAAEVEAVLFDVRAAHYLLDDVAWEQRARVIARMCRNYTCALITRPDQAHQMTRLMALHADFGGESESFRSRTEAREWLLARLEKTI